MVFQLYDQDSNHKTFEDLKKHDYIGEVSFPLAKLMCSGGQRMTVQITGGRNKYDVNIFIFIVKISK